jgi:hypothetical protein
VVAQPGAGGIDPLRFRFEQPSAQSSVQGESRCQDPSPASSPASSLSSAGRGKKAGHRKKLPDRVTRDQGLGHRCEPSRDRDQIKREETPADQAEVRTGLEPAYDGFASDSRGLEVPGGAIKCPTSVGGRLAPGGTIGHVLVTGDQACDQTDREAEGLLRAVADGRDDAAALAAELARHVLTRRDVRLAIGVLQLVELGSPHVLRRAVELAELVREGETREQARRRGA